MSASTSSSVASSSFVKSSFTTSKLLFHSTQRTLSFLYNQFIANSQWRYTLATFPLIVYFHDSFYALYKVNGSSMEPTLYHGDIILVRKSDVDFFGLWNNYNNNDNDIDNNNNQERLKLQEWERHNCMTTISYSKPILQKPPLPITGQIVLYQDPYVYSKQMYNIKRVIGLGGQKVSVPVATTNKIDKNNPTYQHQHTSYTYCKSIFVPPYSLWVQGDNKDNSFDSRDQGTITKNLMIGIATTILWPPTRWGKIPMTSDSTSSFNYKNSNYQRPHWPK